MGLCKCSSKSILGFLALIFSLAAVFLWGTAGYVTASYNEYKNFVNSHYVLIPSIIAIAIGILFFFAGILGCCAMCKDNKCILTMFGVFMFLLLALLVTGSALGIKYRSEIKGSVRNNTNQELKKYDNFDFNKTGHQKDFDFIQIKLKCCGVENYTDWEKTAWEAKAQHHESDKKQYVPYSCCNTAHKKGNDSLCDTIGHGPLLVSHENLPYIYAEGCEEKVFRIFESNGKYIAGAVIAFMVLLILGIICTCALCCLKRREDTPYFSLN